MLASRQLQSETSLLQQALHLDISSSCTAAYVKAVGAFGEPGSLVQVNIANENDLHMLLRSEKADIEQSTFGGTQVSRP